MPLRCLQRGTPFGHLCTDRVVPRPRAPGRRGRRPAVLSSLSCRTAARMTGQRSPTARDTLLASTVSRVLRGGVRPRSPRAGRSPLCQDGDELHAAGGHGGPGPRRRGGGDVPAQRRGWCCSSRPACLRRAEPGPRAGAGDRGAVQRPPARPAGHAGALRPAGPAPADPGLDGEDRPGGAGASCTTWGGPGRGTRWRSTRTACSSSPSSGGTSWSGAKAPPAGVAGPGPQPADVARLAPVLRLIEASCAEPLTLSAAGRPGAPQPDVFRHLVPPRHRPLPARVPGPLPGAAGQGPAAGHPPDPGPGGGGDRARQPLAPHAGLPAPDGDDPHAAARVR